MFNPFYSQVTFLRLLNPTNPMRAVPNSQTAAVIGTADRDSETLVISGESAGLMDNEAVKNVFIGEKI